MWNIRRRFNNLIKLRKTKRIIIILLVSTFCVYLLFDHIGNSTYYYDKKEEIKKIEESIRALGNQGECKIPNLPIDSPEMLSFLEDVPRIICPNDNTDWVVCEKSICKIKPNIIKNLGKITCDFYDILRTSDYNYKYGVKTRSSNYYVLKNSDFAVANCWSENRDSWHGTIIGIRQNVQHRIKEDNKNALNVLMFGLDSLSKNAFIRKLPKSYEYLTKSLNGHVLQGYNILGDGTPHALIPILTGFTELELPEVGKRQKNSEYVNVYPMVWYDYQKNGYVTAFNEDVPHIGTFTYRLNGFGEQPTDHYMRTYYVAIEKDLSSYHDLCVGSQPRHKVMLDYTTQFMLSYETTPRFVFSFHGELSHDSINLVGGADDDITNWMMELNKLGILNNTILIMMSDHGNRFAKVRNTIQGKQEERLPFFSFVFPDWFKKQHKKKYDNFKTNVDRLTTPFDIHATLIDILNLQNYEILQKPFLNQPRAISLFDNISENRSCADAYIEPHWCSCLNWVTIPTKSTEVSRAVYTAIDFINKFTNNYRKLCSLLSLYEIKWSFKLSPHNKSLPKNKSDYGIFANISEGGLPKRSTIIYQVQFITLPGNSVFEASVVNYLDTDQFSVKLTDISRINKYGDQANCIYEVNPELRKYCYCL